jgi:hypothetical protein
MGGLREREGQRHREAAGVRGGQKFLGVRSRLSSEARVERVRGVDRTAAARNAARPARHVAGPLRGCDALDVDLLLCHVFLLMVRYARSPPSPSSARFRCRVTANFSGPTCQPSGMVGEYDKMQYQELYEVLLSLKEANELFSTRVFARFDAMDARFDAMDARFDAMDARFDTMDARFDRMDGRMDRQGDR